MNHVSRANAVPGWPASQYACGSNVSRTNGPRANEIVCFRLDGSLKAVVVAPAMTDLDAPGGGNDYAKYPKGNLDGTGQYLHLDEQPRRDAARCVHRQDPIGIAPIRTSSPLRCPSRSPIASTWCSMNADTVRKSASLEQRILLSLAMRGDAPKVGATASYTIDNCLNFARKSFDEFDRLVEGKTVFDYGCGPGWQAVAMRARCRAERVVGLDIKDDWLEHGTRLADAHHCGDRVTFVTSVPPEMAGRFDVVVSLSASSILQIRRASFRECRSSSGLAVGLRLHLPSPGTRTTGVTWVTTHAFPARAVRFPG